MLSTLKELFGLFTAAPAPATDATHHLQLASAVLLVEMMRADAESTAAERHAAIDALRRRFALADDEVERLFELAEAASRDAPDLYTFTSQLNRGFGAAQKLEVIEHLWEVAFADGVLSHHENQLMLKLGDLLYIPRGDFVAAKQRARAAAGLDAGGAGQ